MGQFDVPDREVSPDPLDLGTLLPRAAIDGVGVDVTLPEGRTASYRLVVTVPGYYTSQAQSSGDPPSIRIVGPGLDRSLNPNGTSYTLLSPGVYSIIFSAPMTGPLDVHLQFVLSADQIEIVLANGVGQGPALSLRLISISPVSPSPVPPASPPVSPSPVPPASPPVGSAPSPTGPPALAAPAPADHGTTVQVSARSTRSAAGPSNSPMTSTASAGTTSFLGLASDLIGRPSGEASESAYLAQGLSTRGDSQAFVGNARAQSLSLLLLQPARFNIVSPDWMIGELPASTSDRADVVGFDVVRVFENLIGLRQGAIRWSESVIAWAGSWTKEREISGDRPTQIARIFPGLAPVQSAIDPGLAAAVREEKSSDAPSDTLRMLTPSVVVVSVVLIAQVFWHYARWRRSRRLSGNGGASVYPAPDLSTDKRVPLLPILQWDRVTLISRPLFRRSRAS